MPMKGSVLRLTVEDRLTNEYHNTSQTPVPSIDISSLLDHIGKLKKGKTVGLDGTVNEHILYGGECLTVHICLLFNAMTRHSFVPTEFCDGIIVQLLKCKHGDASQLDIYRGITLSPVLSKLFESVLLDLFGLFLTSNDSQFGFKKNLGCSHALFAFNETVRYFMNNNSRAFGAFLDISEALIKFYTTVCFRNY